MVLNPNSNMRKALAVIWNERPNPIGYAKLIEILTGVLTKRQVYDAIKNLKRAHVINIVHINNEVSASITIKTSPSIQKTTQRLLEEAELI